MAPGDWIAYTPPWSAGTAPALGNGTLTGSYMMIGKTVHFRMRLLAGTTTTFGTGSWQFTMPVTGATSTTRSQMFPAVAFDSSAAAHYLGLAHNVSSTGFQIIYTTSTVNFNGPNTPMTWATSDTLTVSGTYDAA